MRKLNEQPREVEPVALSIEETCKATGLGRSTIYREMNEGRLRSFKAGRRRMFSPEAIREWRNRLEHQAADPGRAA